MIQDQAALDRARAEALDRAARHDARKFALEACTTLEPGASFSVQLSGSAPVRRAVITAVNGAAWGRLGAGKFRLRKSPDSVTVERLTA